MEQYHQAFVELGAGVAAHLVDLDDEDLQAVGLKKLEKARLRKALAAL